MKKEFEFVGINSGDGECFCFEVDKETFIKITGREPENLDYADGEWNDSDLDFVPYEDSLIRLYPYFLFGEFGKKVKVKLVVEEIN